MMLYIYDALYLYIYLGRINLKEKQVATTPLITRGYATTTLSQQLYMLATWVSCCVLIWRELFPDNFQYQ